MSKTKRKKFWFLTQEINGLGHLEDLENNTKNTGKSEGHFKVSKGSDLTTIWIDQSTSDDSQDEIENGMKKSEK